MGLVSRAYRRGVLVARVERHLRHVLVASAEAGLYLASRTSRAAPDSRAAALRLTRHAIHAASSAGVMSRTRALHLRPRLTTQT